MSKIEWTERSWNPVLGCAVVSPGCTNCYAMRTAHRLGRNPATPDYQGLTRVVNGKPVWTGEMRLANHGVLTDPLRRRAPTTWFVNSMSDLFADGVADSWRDAIWAIMSLTPHHTYQVLTKRPDRMRAYLTGLDQRGERRSHGIAGAVQGFALDYLKHGRFSRNGFGPHYAADFHAHRDRLRPMPLANVWLGVSAEDQRRADERIPILLDTPAAARFVSIEPMLGAISLNSDLGGTQWIGGQRGCGGTHVGTGEPGCPLHPHHHHDERCRKGLDWVIVGGESGGGARPMHPAWAREIRDQCAQADVPFFFKQWGEWAPRDEWEPGARRQRAIQGDGTPVPDDVAPQDVGGHRFALTGKKAAGRLLDGVLHEGMPR